MTQTLATASSSPARPRPHASRGRASELDALVALQPLRAVAAKNGQPSDLTNVLLIGSAELVARAFVAAGWTRALPGAVKADAKAFLALADRHGYQPAPVSLLTLEGNSPDLVFENRTTPSPAATTCGSGRVPAASAGGRSSWRRGRTTWESSSPLKKEPSPIGSIPQIDLERDKIVDDLVFAGAVELRAAVDRPSVSRSGTNAAGDRIETNGAVAALVLR